MEVKQHVIAEVTCAKEFSLFGDLQAISHWDGVEHLWMVNVTDEHDSRYLQIIVW